MPVEGNLFRSEQMSLIQLYIPSEIAVDTVAELGQLGQIQFRDLNPEVNSFQRAFVNEIRRLDEMDRKQRFLKTHMEKDGISISELDLEETFIHPRTQKEVDDIEAFLNEHEARVVQMNTSLETLNKRYLELTELKHVLKETAVFFEEAGSRPESLLNQARRNSGAGASERFLEEDDYDAIERGERSVRSVLLGFVVGVIARSRMSVFERILFRALRGNLLMNYAEIDEEVLDPSTDEPVRKNVFLIFAQGNELLTKIKKICEGLGATTYPVDQDALKRRQDALEVMSRLNDLKTVLDNTARARRIEFSKAASSINLWVYVIRKEKTIYHIMNSFNFDSSRKALIAEGWCPTHSINAIQYALRAVTERTGSTISPLMNEIKTTKMPPTYHRTNKFTSGFQEIVDAYGVAAYQEVNPGLFTCFTFPFLFAVMFGDFGHGVLVALFAGWMCYNEGTLMKQKKLGEIWDMFFGGRYIILMMGLFSIYTGLIYNDLFSKPMNLFGSGYEFEQVPGASPPRWEGVQSHTYPIGVDPAWHGSENALLFSNSYKMKMAIIFGVIHMCFGITLQCFNHIHFNRAMSIYTEYIPQVVFMLSIFGYLALLIIYKWTTNWEGLSAPGLLNTLIYMFLAPGSVADADELYPGQAVIQVILLLIAFICVPWMLLAKPYFLKREHETLIAAGYSDVSHAALEEELDADSSFREEAATGTGDASRGVAGGASEMHREEEFDFGEIMIHQMIHTIEFCLGAISNTASYLRLWALSLAHAQLSQVLWNMVLGNTMTMTGVLQPIFIMAGFAFWFVLTIGILLLMEGLSAFLHALRLHWVEFQNKFYAGSGTKFEPFAFSRLLRDDEE